jgi:hypothetical protein
VLDAWAHHGDLKLHFIQPGKPIQNCFAESFNGKFREECLNEPCFLGPEDARRIAEARRRNDDGVRLHRSLGFLGRRWSEFPRLGLAYAYEQASDHRRPPASTSVL